MPANPIKVIVLVHGGLVQAVHTDSPEAVEIKVFDLDEASFETPAEKARADGAGEGIRNGDRGLASHLLTVSASPSRV